MKTIIELKGNIKINVTTDIKDFNFIYQEAVEKGQIINKSDDTISLQDLNDDVPKIALESKGETFIYPWDVSLEIQSINDKGDIINEKLFNWQKIIGDDDKNYLVIEGDRIYDIQITVI